MSVTAFIRRCLAAGMPFEMALTAAEQFESEPPVPSAAAVRQRRYRERNKASPVTVGDTRDVSDAQRDGAKDAPAHVRDNLPRLVTTGKISSAAGDCADDWPQDHPGGIAKHLASMAGPGLADIAKAPGLTTTAGEIIRWKQMGCSWASDVVPVIEGRTKNRRNSPISSWTLLTNDVLAAKARRERPIEMPDATGPPSGSLTERIGAENAEARRRAFARMDR